MFVAGVPLTGSVQRVVILEISEIYLRVSGRMRKRQKTFIFVEMFDILYLGHY